MSFKFYKESIYWSKRVIEDFRLCDKGIRLNALLIIVRSLYCLNELDTALENGKKYLEADLQPNTSMERWDKKVVLQIMCSTALQLLKTKDAVKNDLSQQNEFATINRYEPSAKKKSNK